MVSPRRWQHLITAEQLSVFWNRFLEKTQANANYRILCPKWPKKAITTKEGRFLCLWPKKDSPWTKFCKVKIRGGKLRILDVCCVNNWNARDSIFGFCCVNDQKWKEDPYEAALTRTEQHRSSKILLYTIFFEIFVNNSSPSLAATVLKPLMATW